MILASLVVGAFLVGGKVQQNRASYSGDKPTKNKNKEPTKLSSPSPLKLWLTQLNPIYKTF